MYSIYTCRSYKMLTFAYESMSHVDQSKHPSLRHMNNGIQGKSRNDRFTWQLM